MIIERNRLRPRCIRISRIRQDYIVGIRYNDTCNLEEGGFVGIRFGVELVIRCVVFDVFVVSVVYGIGFLLHAGEIVLGVEFCVIYRRLTVRRPSSGRFEGTRPGVVGKHLLWVDIIQTDILIACRRPMFIECQRIDYAVYRLVLRV